MSPYIAIKEQITKGLKENIFERLEKSEYIIFIDFKREIIGEKIVDVILRKKQYCRVPIANQELAIASYIDLPIVAFQEQGIKKRDGILDVIQVNPESFASRAGLVQKVVSLVEDKTSKGEWSPKWRNELYIDREESDFEDVNYNDNPGDPARFFHIRVINRHRLKDARQCLSYIENIRDCNDDRNITFETIENKWKGTRNTDVQISPQKFRSFDTLFIRNRSEPGIARIGYNSNIVDFTGYSEKMKLLIPGIYEISYVIFSINFSPVKAKYEFRLDRNIDNIKISKISD